MKSAYYYANRKDSLMMKDDVDYEQNQLETINLNRNDSGILARNPKKQTSPNLGVNSSDICRSRNSNLNSQSYIGHNQAVKYRETANLQCFYNNSDLSINYAMQNSDSLPKNKYPQISNKASINNEFTENYMSPRNSGRLTPIDYNPSIFKTNQPMINENDPKPRLSIFKKGPIKRSNTLKFELEDSHNIPERIETK